MTQDWNRFLSVEAKNRHPSVMKTVGGPDIISFGCGMPHSDCFPLKGLSIKYTTPDSNFKKTAIGSNEDDANSKEGASEIYQMCQYMSASGTTYFKKWTHGHIEEFHKPAFRDWDCLIQSGATLSFDQILRMICDPEIDTILAEELTYPCFLESCKPLRLKVFGVKMDADGVDVNDLDMILTNWYEDERTKKYRKPKFYYCMPFGQNPSGITMTIQRKKDLLQICQKHDILVVEDDPYFHLQLDPSAKNVPSLLKFDNDGRVLRIDSFSKMMMPGMRISVVTANKFFVKKLTMMNELSIHSAAAPSQLIVYMLMQEWRQRGFHQWIEYIQANYRRRRDIILDAFDKYLPKSLCSWNKPSSGMFLWIKLQLDKFPKLDRSEDDSEWALELEDLVYDQALKEKIYLTKGHWFMIDDMVMAGFRATYASGEYEDLYEGSRRLGIAIRHVHENLYEK
ncbi:hypothetical protein BRETT_001037 [Brettanomyces bruxellensis]|uniref:Aminotransferase class I/classII large domain-containing protein n=1 Tax=Dekkera bruxellensis TaxID=5007 RepID=A0A871RAX0_DEKBR|nr:uncharacterized protein BRETT_001037 [Brettanomyces bruxellensis]QOU21315.1 hypothetical protein BRETT_001037 [Brettanomyces bruxellensis]